MDLVELHKLSRAISDTAERHAKRTPQIVVGTVSAVGPLMVTVDGDTVSQPAGCGASYLPAVGDRVICHLARHELIAIDSVTWLPWPNTSGAVTAYNVEKYGATGGASDDVPAFQAAADAASAAGGGTVFVPGGTTYTFGSAPKVGPGGSAYCIELPSNVWLEIDPTATIKLAPGLDAGMVLLQTNATNVGVIGRGTLDGNKANQTDSGIDGAQCCVYGSAIANSYFDVVCQNSIRQGAYISNGSWLFGRFRVENNGVAANTLAGFEDDANSYSFFEVLAVNNAGPGVHVVGGSSLLDNHVVLKVVAYGNQWGISAFYAQGSRFDSPICESNTQDGILLENCNGCVTVAPYLDKNARNGYFDYQGSDNTVVAPTARNNNYGGASAGVGLNFESSSNFLVSSPRCFDDQATKTQLYGVQTDAASTGRVDGGDLTGNANGPVNLGNPANVAMHSAGGYNPVGQLAAPGTALPASGTAVAAQAVDSFVSITAGADPVTAVVTGGTSISYTIPASSTQMIFVPAGQTLTPTYAGGAPTYAQQGN